MKNHDSQMEKSATLFRPKLIVAGASAYARLYDYARIRKVLLFKIFHSKLLYICCIIVAYFRVKNLRLFIFWLLDRSVTSRKLYCWLTWHISVDWLPLVSSHRLSTTPT